MEWQDDEDSISSKFAVFTEETVKKLMEDGCNEAMKRVPQISSTAAAT
jgi:hypothetical protein